MNPSHQKLLQKAQALDRSGAPRDALAAYQAFLAAEPNHVEAWSACAAKLLMLGQPAEARKACESALRLDASHLTARAHLGRALMQLGLLDQAEAELQLVLQEDGQRKDARLFWAECKLYRRDFEAARVSLEKVGSATGFQAQPSPLQAHHAELWGILSLGLFEARRFPEASEACERALQLDPRNFTAKANLGSIRMAEGRLTEAERLFSSLVAGHPQRERGHLLLITCLSRMGQLPRADQVIAKVIRLAPRDATVHKSVLATYYTHGRWTEYTAEIERFRQVEPASPEAEYEHSFLHLLTGDLPRGWERYEARLRIALGAEPPRTFDAPAWDGTSFTGKTLLVWAEQGLGDTLMFVRYLPRVKALGGTVLLEAQPSLAHLVATCDGLDGVIPAGVPLPAFDLQIPLMSLPRLFRTDLSSIPADIPYLDVPAQVPHQQALLERLAQSEGRARIGLVWAGRPEYGRDFERSIPAATLAPLAALEGVAWYSFQVGGQEPPPLPGLIPLAPALGDFSDTAYALSGMDLLITVDTSVAHLAGALGIPTLLLLPFQPDWRWLLDRSDTPWYPSVRLYRQPAYGDWAAVIAQLVRDLSQET